MNYASKMQSEVAKMHKGPARDEEGAVGGVVEAEVLGDGAMPSQEAKPRGYEGLPAKIQIPWGARQTTFERDLLSTDAPRPVFVVLVASRFAAALVTVAALAVLALALAMRRDLSAGARTFAARFRRAPAAGA
jgi:hypothetical protein